MELLLVLLMNVLSGMIIFHEYRIKSLSLSFWVSIFAVFNVPHSLDLLLRTNTYSIEVMNKASMFVIGFSILYLIQRYIFSYNNRLDWELAEWSGSVEKRFMRYLFIAMGLSVTFWVIGLRRVSGSVFNSSWSDTLQVNNSFSIVGSYLFMSSCGLLVLLRYKRKSILSQLIFVALALVVVALTRARINLIPLFVPLMILEIFYKKNFKSVVRVVMLGSAFIFVVSFVLYFRFLGDLENARNIDLRMTFDAVIHQVLNGQGEFGLRRAMYHFIDNDNQFANFNKGITYIRLLLLPLPNSIVRIKPRDFAYDMWDAVNPHRKGIGGTYHPTFFGDLFGNFGIYGFVFGIVWGFVFMLVDRLVNGLPDVLKMAIIAPFSVMYLLLARGSVYNAIANGFWSLILLRMIFFISRITVNSQRFN
jgi:hypothetical protein